MHFLLAMALGPALLTALAALASGAGLRSSWGAPMVVLSGLLAVALLSDKYSPARLRRTAIGAGVLIVLVSGLYYAHMRYGVAITGAPLRGNWPQARISETLEQRWQEETGAPLRIVAGDIWTAGLIGLGQADPPSVLIDGDYATSPWVTPADVERSGALIVWSEEEPPSLTALLNHATRGRLTVRAPYARAEAAPNIIINYAIIPPRDPASPSVF